MADLGVLRHVESRLRLSCDKVGALMGKLDDFTFRAQRIATAIRGGGTGRDHGFIHDMQVFRREIKTFAQEVALLPDALMRLHPIGGYDVQAEAFARSIWQWAERLPKQLEALWEKARISHGHMREAEAKVESWYLVSDCEQTFDASRAVAAAGKQVIQRFSAGAPG